MKKYIDIADEKAYNKTKEAIKKAKKMLRENQILKFKIRETMSLLQENLSQKLFFLQNIRRTCCVQKLF